MKYCTFYFDIFGGVRDLEKFKTEAEALKNFRANYRSYFQVHTKFSPRKTPCSYGFPHRKYWCMSIKDFKANFEEGGAE